jgi:hypothetical protein
MESINLIVSNIEADKVVKNVKNVISMLNSVLWY